MATSTPVPAVSRPFTRKSTVLELSSTRTGRGFKMILLRQLPAAETEEQRLAMIEVMMGLPIETLVQLAQGKLSWDIADTVIDLANGKPHRAVPRLAKAGSSAVRQQIRRKRGTAGH